MQRRRGMWLVFAGGLFGLAAWLMVSGQGEVEAPPPAKVEFPRWLRPEERQRAERRRTYMAPPVAATADAGMEPARPKDPVLAALPRGKGKSAMVIEANALRHSPLGEMLLECLMRQGSDDLEKFKQQTGVDPLQDLDRMVITEDGVILSGNFGDPRLKQVLQGRAPTNYDYGTGGRLFEPALEQTLEDGSRRRNRISPIGMWNDQMLVFGRSPDEVKQILDRVEGRGPDEPPVIDEGKTYGEMYGVLSVEQLQKLLPPDQKELAAKLAEVAENVELHVDASSDFAMTARVNGADPAKVTDLGKSLGGALSLARMKAQTEGDTKLAQLLDFAKVRPDGESFNLEMAVPLDAIKKQLTFCQEQQEPR
ncbi:hypothetical protein [Melittangium boletus]|uniref:Uncharacterized protein n=1 Tax=Melittangium boletus DSM 14713 TaxID=1294270 RepID=A0A250INN6_9BACT|nr:hypothetical protein [Melittangium boletus]ATB32860.1 hypothetical protein MEBOL_006349 [Melittangium boletus DSM 14713]